MPETQTKTCQNCKQPFTIEPEDFGFYEKVKVPPPTFCPECRFQRRLSFRNERKLFRNTNGLTGAPILTIYPPESERVVYTDEDFRSDKWDPMSYGVDYDFSRPFLSQLHELDKKIPRPARNFTVGTMVNSDFSANCDDLKNCYLLFNAQYSEDCAYGNGVDRSKTCFDNSHCNGSERCYNSFWIKNCYRAHFCSQCSESRELWFCKDCLGCSNCFGCVNLRNKQYCIFNEQYSKEEYAGKLARMKLNSRNGIAEADRAAHAFWEKFPNKYIQGIKNVSSTGAYVTNSKNVKCGYLVRESEDCKYVQYLQTPPNKNCYDFTIWGEGNEFGYESMTSGLGTFNLRFSIECWPSVRDIEYGIFCHGSSNLFGCVGLKKKEYCILNKQYSKDEFFALRARIIEHMDAMPYTDKAGRVYRYGEFPPIEFSPFAYNQTLAQDHFPYSKEEALKNGYAWEDPAPKEFQITVLSTDLPDTIEEVGDDILKEIIRCERCAKAFRIIRPELDFLREERIPLPRFCVDCRYVSRIKQRLPSRLFRRPCMCAGSGSADRAYPNTIAHFHGTDKCPNTFETAYTPDRPEIVYCEQCYQAEVA